MRLTSAVRRALLRVQIELLRVRVMRAERRFRDGGR